MASTLRRPVWLVGHVLALVTVVVFVNLGFWQLDRARWRADLNDTIAARQAAAPVALGDLLADGGDPESLEFRPVRVRGTYRPAQEVMLSTRFLQGRPGHHVLTPLESDTGMVVIVDRGWVPLDANDPPVTEAPPPEGPVEVDGWVLAPRTAERSGPVGADEVTFVSDIDLGRLAAQVDGALAPVAVMAADHDPSPDAALPVPGTLPELDPGPHLGYAGQWFLFAGVVVVGYPILLWRTATDRDEPDGGATGPDRPGGVPASSGTSG